MHVELIPLLGTVINDQTIHFGMNRCDVEALLGEGLYFEHEPESVFYFQEEMRIDYDRYNHVIFIEFVLGIEARIQPTLLGRPVFLSDAYEIYALLSELNHSSREKAAERHTYTFPEISVQVRRDHTYKSVQQLIDENIREGTPMTQEEITEELRWAEHFSNFGFGIKGYFQRNIQGLS